MHALRLGHADKAAAAARAREREVRKREVVERRKNTLKEARCDFLPPAPNLAMRLFWRVDEALFEPVSCIVVHRTRPAPCIFHSH
jgi:hypothetical protein